MLPNLLGTGFGRKYTPINTMKTQLTKKKQVKHEPSNVKCKCKDDLKRCDLFCNNALD